MFHEDISSLLDKMAGAFRSRNQKLLEELLPSLAEYGPYALPAIKEARVRHADCFEIFSMLIAGFEFEASQNKEISSRADAAAGQNKEIARITLERIAEHYLAGKPDVAQKLEDSLVTLGGVVPIVVKSLMESGAFCGMEERFAMISQRAKYHAATRNLPREKPNCPELQYIYSMKNEEREFLRIFNKILKKGAGQLESCHISNNGKPFAHGAHAVLVFKN